MVPPHTVLLDLTLLQLVLLHRQTDRAKDLQILPLRHQLAIVERKLDQPLRISRVEKFTLALLTIHLKRATGQTIQQLSDSIRIFRPETVLKWHRELVRRKWTYRHQVQAGRPRTEVELERLVLPLTRENDWGNGKIAGELLKLGYTLSDETVATLLKRHGIPPLPQRRPSLSWRHLMTHYKKQLLACDFFTIDMVFLQTLYLFFFIELGTRRVHFAGCTAHPTGAWVTQQARQLVWEVGTRELPLRFLIHDRDTKFTASFDAVFTSEHIKIIPHLIAHPMPTPTRSGGSEPSAKSVWTSC